MAKSLFVGNLPWSVTSEELEAKFGEVCSVISARVVSRDGRSRGFAFVDVNDEDMDKAIQAMNGFSLGGREITVNEARPKAEKIF
ncbi:RNA-binding protein [candidate division WOR-1 bacterium RIFOXYD2_FULL_36_8]|uniref:RNA-binding protein n=1 Tax=candidate division WOR-1 bacterium RIFOXYB2_FULL_36_35 TaxID=1802578 RepID=A0A1F4S474_UNCSA|nr:MAG: RNA-binding protein [candidate division WOR-1 bacterium RIFOXYA2_FULL_36_21]OGC14229.1 MAG: RNA-binding protein [candidate division WOR-1 bacterium RIFOXYA12_FULL_36_13]OGC15234.1 MAG: RNA-binding protein [candidate division WOR-1 bacterium RIFOXYB2_FULL_36_35]OGC38941.1 MAG: RNA-binding protein [candidate division WOR-1 bacterium RIFOXYD2_FULL_36_8]